MSFIKWQDYALHSDNQICGFFGDYRWLSNFHLCDVEFEGLVYPSSENAYQAAKVRTFDRIGFIDCSPAASKRIWKPLTRFTREEWDEVKEYYMQKIVFEKFARNKDLRDLLVATYPKYLEERNAWKDTFWGVDIKLGGKNKLGMMLMAIRNYHVSL